MGRDADISGANKETIRHEIDRALMSLSADDRRLLLDDLIEELQLRRWTMKEGSDGT